MTGARVRAVDLSLHGESTKSTYYLVTIWEKRMAGLDSWRVEFKTSNIQIFSAILFAWHTALAAS